MLIHLYLEQASFTQAQFQDAKIGWIANDTKTVLDKAEEKFRKTPMSARNPNYYKKLAIYAKDRLNYDMAAKSISENKLSERALPLLNINVGVNDYIPVMGFLLVIICINVWMSSRGILMPLGQLGLGEKPAIQKLIPLYVAFVPPADPNGQDRIARTAQYFAVWFPFVSFLLTAYIDFRPFINAFKAGEGGKYADPPAEVVLRLTIYIVILLLLFACTIGSSINLKNITNVVKGNSAQQKAKSRRLSNR
jgi:hypothetical protein